MYSNFHALHRLLYGVPPPQIWSRGPIMMCSSNGFRMCTFLRQRKSVFYPAAFYRTLSQYGKTRAVSLYAHNSIDDWGSNLLFHVKLSPSGEIILSTSAGAHTWVNRNATQTGNITLFNVSNHNDYK